jgi:cytidylate kinase
MSKINIAIDGPVASGKGTITKIIAKKLGYNYLDTGSMYRAVAYFLNSKNVIVKDFKKSDLDDLKITFNDENLVCVNGKCIEEYIRNPQISELSSIFSSIIDIREFLVILQKEIIEEKGYILEGRDATTIIAPNSELKIYLTADVKERARRRQLDYSDRGVEKDFEVILEEIMQRDERDMNKGEYSLKIVDSAIVIDNTSMSVEDQVNKIVDIAKEKIN